MNRSPTGPAREPPTAGGELFLARQPIVNSEQKLIGYELLFRPARAATAAAVDDGALATSELLVNTFNRLGAERVLGDKRAFINVTAELLGSEVLTLLPPDKVVLEILEDVEPTPAIVARCQALKALGYPLALDDFRYRPALEPLLALASYVKLDLRALGLEGLAREVARLRGRGLRLLAEKVETRGEFQALRALLVSCYQGYYFARPETLAVKRMDPAVAQVMQLFNLVTAGAEPARIEEGFRRDVALSYGLLRYINSVGFGLVHRVETVRHALVVLGSTRLSRWLTLLMFSQARGSNPAPQALFRTALGRARLVELLGVERLGAAHQDFLFMTGMFSLLDAMLDMPLATALGDLALPEPVREALLAGRGPYWPYLQLARACEQPEGPAPDGVDIDAATVAGLQLEALAWAEGVAAAG